LQCKVTFVKERKKRKKPNLILNSYRIIYYTYTYPTAKALKARLRAPGAAPYTPLTGRTLSMVFQKRSTRTRVSAEGGFAALGGHAIFLGSEDVQLGKNETLLDTARVLGRFSDIVLARVFAHADIDVLCRECPAPVINALSDAHHPLQLLADVQTLEERLGPVGAARSRGWATATTSCSRCSLPRARSGTTCGTRRRAATRPTRPSSRARPSARAPRASSSSRRTTRSRPCAARMQS